MSSVIRVSLTLLLLALPGILGAAGENPAGEAADGPRVVAYYFHGNVRCATCRKLEAYSKEAIEKGFEEDIAAGRLEFRQVNIDDTENRHFLHDYQLVTKALVLVEYVDGEQTRWQDLKLIWKLVGDKAGFITYVQSSTAEFMAGE